MQAAFSLAVSIAEADPSQVRELMFFASLWQILNVVS